MSLCIFLSRVVIIAIMFRTVIFGLNPSRRIFRRDKIFFSSSKFIDGFALHRNPIDQALEVTSHAFPKPFRIDFTSPTIQKRLNEAKNELVVQAVGSSYRLVVDLTAGLGRDATLAAAGKHLVLIERNPNLHSLLQDALNRLFIWSPLKEKEKKIAKSLVNRIILWNRPLDATDKENAANVVKSILSKTKPTFSVNEISIFENIVLFQRIYDQDKAFVVYLDPMYPLDPSQRDAKSRKDTQILHMLTRDTEPRYSTSSNDNTSDETALFATAVSLSAIGAKRIVVKRGRKDRVLATDRIPTNSIVGSTQRFDVYDL